MKKIWLALKSLTIHELNNVYDLCTEYGLPGIVMVCCVLSYIPVVMCVIYFLWSIGNYEFNDCLVAVSSVVLIMYMLLFLISFPVDMFVDYVKKIKPSDVPKLKWSKKKDV